MKSSHGECGWGNRLENGRAGQGRAGLNGMHDLMPVGIGIRLSEDSQAQEFDTSGQVNGTLRCFDIET